MPLDPCGQIFDVLRSCYETDCAFGEGDDTVGRIQWFFAADGATVFPGPSPFRSRIWEDLRDGAKEGIGEVIDAPREYYLGTRPIGYDGTHAICQDQSFYRAGVPSPPPELERDDDARSICCLDNPEGILLGGSFEATRTPCPASLYWDDFHGPDDPLAAHPLNSGGTWDTSAAGGFSFDILSNQCVVTGTDTGNYRFAMTDAGVTNQTLYWQFLVGSPSYNLIFALNADSSSNPQNFIAFLIVQNVGAPITMCYVFRVNSGAYTQLATLNVPALAVGPHWVGLTANRGGIGFDLDFVRIISSSYPGTFAGTNVGMGQFTDGVVFQANPVFIRLCGSYFP